ncbi:pseudouridine synthase-like protein TruD/Pus7 [Pleomassaria siparia CBS 279.74]|uniref:Pseudouridine synthase-like protein TruD/Pus7 n=1 Tax=Pleomassaria siparia CBS 279.74 TaxID=1314801 RepID=A0A6G1KSL4_9PLEO|nr:pseudouridine synthase-like protein TruD/Pus7 [Pleomassaria siparia CBS 279.74]
MSSSLKDDNSRPLKRARLDDNTSSSAIPNESISALATTAPAAPIASDNITALSDLDREIRAGITEYVCPENLGFTGTLKQRYTDFLVNEIGLDGKVLHLKSIGAGDVGKVVEKTKVEKSELKVDKVEESKDDVEMEGVQKVAGDGASNGGEAAGPKIDENQEQEATSKVSDEDLNTLQSMFGETATLEILALVKQIRKKYDKKAKDFKAVIAPPITDKEKRTQAHQCLRRIFPAMLESSMEKDQSIRIKAVPPKERGTKRKRGNGRDQVREQDRRRGQLGWEELGGEYLHFTLYKENKDTMEVIGFLGSKLNNGSKGFGWAGTKDRRACTVQRISVKRQTADRMNHLNKLLFNAAIGDFEFLPHDLSLGDLMGNEFVITLRNCRFQNEQGLDFSQRVELAHEVVSKAVKDFADKGYINYYGLQRFGTFAASTDTVGLKLLQEDLKGAIDDLLTYSEVALAAADSTDVHSTVLVSQDDRNRAKALDIWKTKQDGSRALAILPKKFSAERNIIQHLSSKNSRSGKHDRVQDWQGALMCVPRNLRLMYVHAYQSLVWNVAAGKRWTLFGSQVVEGDLVLVHEHKDKEAGSASPILDTIDQNGEEVINPSGENSGIADEDMFERARPLSASEAASGKYSVFDIVLPQPGFDVEYPKNAVGKFYEEFMGSEKGGRLNPHKMRRSWREISLSGGYRKFLSKPLGELSFEIRQYEKEEEQFVETDLQKLKLDRSIPKGGMGKPSNGPPAAEAEAEAEDVEEGEMEVEQEEEKEPNKIAVVLKMQLASSQYATIALRELMKAGGVQAFKPEFMGGR